MSMPKRNQSGPNLPQGIVRCIIHPVSQVVRSTFSQLLRFLFWLELQRRQPSQGFQGFILPTTILLLLVVSLAVGSIGLRTLSRTQQAVGERQQQVIYNAATPAIDRARAKLEYLFTQDPRLPNGVPGENDLLAMMLNDGLEHNGAVYPLHQPEDNTGNEVDNPYKFPDEEQLDLNGDGQLDNAWQFDADLPDDGDTDKTAKVIYSIIFDTPDPTDAELSLNDTRENEDSKGVQARSAALMVRNGPLSLANATSACVTQTLDPEGGWFSGTRDQSKLLKNFQIDAVVIPGVGQEESFVPDNTGTIATLELQQDRQIDKGNKWGAWFNNDLEIFPGEPFPWNGAMYTNGNLVIGQRLFRAHLISSPASCLNTSPEDSEIVVGTQGEVVVGRFDEEKAGPTDQRARVDIFPANVNALRDKELKQNNDSVTSDGENSAVLGKTLGIDPAILMLTNQIKRRDEDTAQGLAVDPWDPGDSIDQRVVRLPEDSDASEIGLDDVYRADDRAGPLSLYNINGTKVSLTELGKSLGDDLTDNNLIKTTGTSAEDVGADGYWERRARNQGMRIIVGQRLELGNSMGWGGLDPTGTSSGLNPDATYNNFYVDDSYDDPGEAGSKPGFYNDPLMPWDTCHPDESPNDGTLDPSTNNNNRCHEARQRRTLRDNQAAVQATVIYHADSSVTPDVSDNDTPKACLASVVHPGTFGTLKRSATFADLTAGVMDATSSLATTYPLVISDFFAGRGTNGWEFEVPPALASINADMTRSLWNLAYYAGDPMGGAPSFPVVQGEEEVVHPYPYMSMWGDFSMLRRILETKGTTPTSPADKTTLHTAECLLGMLAYNVDYLAKFDVSEVKSTSNINVATIQAALDVIDSVAANAPIPYFGELLSTTAVDAIKSTFNSPLPYTGGKPPDMYIAALQNWIEGNETLGLAGDPAVFTAIGQDPQQVLAVVRLYVQKQQVERDRQFGFDIGSVPTCASSLDGRLCTNYPKYPILYSLFPDNGDGVIDSSDNHGERNGAGLNELNTRGFDPANDYPFSLKPGTANLTDSVFNGNDEDLYKWVDVSNVALKPRALASWTLPKVEGAVNDKAFLAPVDQESVLIACVGAACGGATANTQGKLIDVGFKDAAFMDGRQIINTRALDLDIDLLRQTKVPGINDYWIPLSGIVYAFREDAVREDMVVRPKTADATCETAAELATDNCLMKAAELSAAEGADRDAFVSTDPNISDGEGITSKPVDFSADPDRRPYGFRLRNGETLKRNGDNGIGLSFISDNPVYILGNFNWHREKDANITRPEQQLQEFKTRLTYDAAGYYDNFYDRTDIDPQFASNEDDWRPAEIVSDAITILSINFCDGSVDDVFDWVANSKALTNGGNYNCQEDGHTSYLNWPVPTESQAKSQEWVRENPFDPSSPVIFTRNGNPLVKDGGAYKDYDKQYIGLDDGRDFQNLLIAADDTTVNASLISRIIPSRQYQSNGGFHNFPRLLEDWQENEAALNISGAFFQLDFSRSATAPYDQLQWEPLGQVAAESPGGVEAKHPYYKPAERRWGYDVALRYAPSAPIASRFVAPSLARNEYYREPPAEDPYIITLCEAALGTNCPIP